MCACQVCTRAQTSTYARAIRIHPYETGRASVLPHLEMNLASGCTDIEVTQTTGPPIRGRTEGAPEGDARREDTAELQPISPIF